MARSSVSDPNSTQPRSAALEQACAMDAEPAVKARMLRELAAWYRAFAARAANPVIWESRLLTAEDLEVEAKRIDPKEHRMQAEPEAKGDNR